MDKGRGKESEKQDFGTTEDKPDSKDSKYEMNEEETEMEEEEDEETATPEDRNSTSRRPKVNYAEVGDYDSCQEEEFVLKKQGQPKNLRLKKDGTKKRRYERGVVKECEYCHKMFDKNDKYTTHVNAVHLGIREHLCPECPKRFAASSQLKTHVETVHMGLKKFVCTICNKALSSKYSLINHTRSHTGEKPWSCEVCGKSFSDQSAFIAHKKTHAEGFEGYTCEYCPKKYNYTKQLNEHIRLAHLGVFNASAERKRILNEERRAFLGLPPTVVKPWTPPKEKKPKAEPKADTDGGGYTCHECGKWFQKPSKLRRHLGTAHSKNDSSLNPMDLAVPLAGLGPDGQLGYMCKECGSMCKSLKSIKEHVATIHFNPYSTGEGRRKKQETPPKEKRIKLDEYLPKAEGLNCHLCEKTFKQTRYLREHILIIHEMRGQMNPEAAPTIPQHQIELQSKLMGEFGGDELANVLNFVRAMQEEDVKNFLAQGNEIGFRPALEALGFVQAEKTSVDYNAAKEIEPMDNLDVKMEVSDDSSDGGDESGGDESEGDEAEGEDAEAEGDEAEGDEAEGDIGWSNFDDLEKESEAEESNNDDDDNFAQKMEGEPIKCEVTIKGEAESDDEQETSRSPTDRKVKNLVYPKDETIGETSSADEKPRRVRRVRKKYKVKEKVPVMCPECGKIFKKPSRLKVHMITHTEDTAKFNAKDLIEQLGKECFKCLECQKEFRKKSHVLDHIRGIHMDMEGNLDPNVKYEPKRLKLPLDLPPLKVCTQVKKTAICPECGETYVSKQSMERHLATVHHGLKEFICEYCQREFAHPVGLKRHIESIHLGMKYQCDSCECNYISQTALTNHIMVTHTKERTFFCDICAKEFNSKSYLNQHILIHNPGYVPPKSKPKKPAWCDECGRDYSSRSGLNAHIDAMHKGLKNFICNLCDRSFGRRSCLAAHKQTHHGIGPSPKPRVKKQKVEPKLEQSRMEAAVPPSPPASEIQSPSSLIAQSPPVFPKYGAMPRFPYPHNPVNPAGLPSPHSGAQSPPSLEAQAPPAFPSYGGIRPPSEARPHTVFPNYGGISSQFFATSNLFPHHSQF